MALFDNFLSSLKSDVSQARQSLPSTARAFFDPNSGVDRSPNTPSQAELMANPELARRTEQMILADMVKDSRSRSRTSGRNGVGPQGPAVDDETPMTPAEAYSEAIRPRDVTYSNIFGTTAFDSETGALSTEAADPFRQFTEGLMGQLSGAMQAYQQFDPAAQAQRYIDATTARQTEQRDLQDQTNLSRLIASGSLGRSAQARAERDLIESRDIQDLQTQFMAEDFAEKQRQQQLGTIGGLFNVASGVAQQQFAPYQIALETVPTLQEIYGAPQEPLFQEGMFEKQLQATRQANRAQQSSDLFGMLFGLL
jgi:hypothetical protein